MVDLINSVDVKLNSDKFNRFSINLLNTKFNHVDLLTADPKNIEGISTEEYKQIMEDSDFYIEKMGVLCTVDQNYKIVNEYNELVKEWKEENKISDCAILIKSDINKFIGQYDDKVHRFFNTMTADEINDDLYNEIDLKNAYYNYDKNKKYYHGLPSGSYMSCSGKGFTNDLFNEQLNNKLVGWYEIEIKHDVNKLSPNLRKVYNTMGLNNKTKHILYSSQIKLFIDNNITFKYLIYVICPSVDIKMDPRFMKYIEGDELTDNKEGNIRAYCKLVATMLIESSTYSIDIKSKSDRRFYNTLEAEKRGIFSVEEYKWRVVKEVDEPKSLRHFSLAIHAYSQTNIMEQMFKMNIDDLIGVKVDAIVYKKEASFKYNKKLFKKPCESKIKSLLMNSPLPKVLAVAQTEEDEDEDERECEDYGLDVIDGINHFNKIHHIGEDDDEIRDKIIEPIREEKIEISSGFFKSYCVATKNEVVFDIPFSGQHITKRIMLLNGAGGCGKTHSVLSSSNFIKEDIVMTSSCWELIASKAEEFNITGLSQPKILGTINGKVCEEVRINPSYIIDDELTLQDTKIVTNIINKFPRAFIILIGDIDNDGLYYQCSISNNIFNPAKCEEKVQCITYTKNYRFDDELNNKVNDLRAFMRENQNDKEGLFTYVKKEFNQCFEKIENVKFKAEDIGISCLKNKIDKLGVCEFSKPFYDTGSAKQYTVKNTNFRKKLYKGVITTENAGAQCTLFRTIHSFQGRQLDKDNRIIILFNSKFDFNLLYTAISRARRIDQIIIIDQVSELI